MSSRAFWVALWLSLYGAVCGASPAAQTVHAAAPVAADLSTTSSEELLKTYQQLRSLQIGVQWAVAENVVWERDAARFTFKDGRLAFAAPVGGRVLAAVFTGQGTFELNPPTTIDKHQISRFTRDSKLVDSFHEAVFFFTDGSGDELQKLVNVRQGGNTQPPGNALRSAEKKYSQNFNDWWENRSRRNPEMRNLAARMLADLTDPSSRGFFLADFKGEHSGDLLYQISWNRDNLLYPGSANDEEVMLVHYKPGEYSEWWSGFHLKSEYAANPHPEHRKLLAHCREERIDAEIGKDKKLSANAEMNVEIPGGAARLLPVNLEGVLRISSVTDESGKKLPFIQEARQLDNDPWVILPQPAVAGQVYKLKITYDEDSTRDSRIIFQQGSGLYYVTARESWFPSLGAFDDRTHYILHFSSPKKFRFVGTGRLLKSEKEGDSLATKWESEIPLSVVGFNYGDFVAKSQSDSNLTVTAYSGREVPDELKSLDSTLNMMELAAGPGHGDAAARYGLMPGGFNTAAMAGQAAQTSLNAMRLFSYYFGELPFKSIAVTEQPVREFGQSWPTLIFLPYDSLLDSTTRHSLHLQDAAEEREFYDTVAVHEMSHQWWGHTVGWKTYHDQWLSEGFADFSASLYLRKTDPKKVKGFWDLKRKWLLSGNRAGHRPVDVAPLWMAIQSNSYLEPGNYQALVYFKGAYVLEMLRVLMEDLKSKEPDAPFIAMMRDFVKTYEGKNASTEDFRRVVEKHTRVPMDWFFNEWVYGTEIPHYDFSYSLNPGRNGQTMLHVSLAQLNVSDGFIMKLPVYVEVNGQMRRLGTLGVKGSTTTTADVPLPFHPERVSLDEYHSVLCTMKQ